MEESVLLVVPSELEGMLTTTIFCPAGFVAGVEETTFNTVVPEDGVPGVEGNT
jgi:hypothetical protein